MSRSRLKPQNPNRRKRNKRTKSCHKQQSAKAQSFHWRARIKPSILLGGLENHPPSARNNDA